MNYSAIDGDIADFLNAQPYPSGAFATEDLRAYLLNEGHPTTAVIAAVIDWQQSRFWQLDPGWEMFSLSAAGVAAVEDLRRR